MTVQRREVRSSDHPIEALDAALVEARLVGEQARDAVGERRLRQRRPVDGKPATDEEGPDPVSGEAHRAGGACDAVADDRDLGPHPPSSPTRSTTSRHQAG